MVQTKQHNKALAIELIAVGASSPPEQLALLHQYFSVRDEVFPDAHYLDGPNEYDIDPENIDTTKHNAGAYILAMKDGKVIGGASYYDCPHSQPTIKVPPVEGGVRPGEVVRISDLLPDRYLREAGLDPEAMKFIRPSGLAVKKSEQRMGNGTKIAGNIFEFVEDKADFFQVNIYSTNLSIVPKVLQRYGFSAILFPENSFLSGDGEVVAVPVLFTKKHPEVVRNMIEKHGIGMSPTQFLDVVQGMKEEYKDFDGSDFDPEHQKKIYDVMRSTAVGYKSALRAVGKIPDRQNDRASWMERFAFKDKFGAGRVSDKTSRGDWMKR